MDGGSSHCTGGNNQDYPPEKEKQKAKCLSDEALQIAEKRRVAKSKGEKERYPSEYRVPKNSKEG